MTSHDLLRLILQYKYPWEVRDKNSEPAQIRLKQIEALAQALDISVTSGKPDKGTRYGGPNGTWLSRNEFLAGKKMLDYIVDGEFLNDLSPQAINMLKEKFQFNLNMVYEDRPDYFREIKDRDFHWFFTYTMNYRLRLYSISSGKFGGMLEGFSSGLYYSYHLQGEMNAIIESNTENIDNNLAMMLDPTGRDIPLTELISKYNFPDADLGKIDSNYSSYDY